MKKYPLFKVHVPIDEALAQIRDVFESGFINEGSKVTELTKELQRILDADRLILTNSCTSSLTLALRLAGVGPDDDVVTTSMTCVASNTPIVTMGANIVWADIDPTTGMLDPSSVAKSITPRTKAVLVVAWAGTPPDLEPLLKICREKNVKLILDVAHAFGARYNNKPVHQWADYTCYSFQAIKHVTTGDGGALVCLNEDDYRRSKAMKWFGIDRDAAKDASGNWKGQHWDFDITEAGFKFNMNNVAAAIGLAQVPHIEQIISTHQDNARKYREAFSDSEHVTPLRVPQGSESVHWVYTVLLSSGLAHHRDDILAQLNGEGILAGLVHVPNDAYTCFRDFQSADLPGVEEFFARQISLPVGWWLSADDIEHIAQRVLTICNER